MICHGGGNVKFGTRFCACTTGVSLLSSGHEEDTPEEDYLDALGALFDVSTEFLFDLVRIEHASPRLQRRIEENGLPL